MLRFVLGRLAQAAFVLLGVTFIIFVCVWALPGDPVMSLAAGQELSPSTIAAIRQAHHLDDPLLVQYGHYMKGLLTFDLGNDFQGRLIADEMSRRWPVTVQLALTAWVFQALFGLGLGMLSAIRHRRLIDHAVLGASMLMISVPIFVLGFFLQLVFGSRLGWLPVAGPSAGWPTSYVLPAIVLSAFGTASVIRLLRSEMIDSLRSEYVRTARAKGLSARRVYVRHAFRNSLIPAVTLLGIELGMLMTGAIIVEGIFNLPGIGQYLYQSISRQEGVVVVTLATMMILVFLVANIVVDLLYAVLDPRIIR
ncbi:ABC transporter permease [Phytohabitans kaempferiae]|uniref:ABC transporter permease n=1 Tax=Phytohabitans kaempferiae TaxID=1620943 RepID=A0ABV6MHR0_9ACTN